LLSILLSLLYASHSDRFILIGKLKKNEALIDSLKIAEYLYSLPIWGAKVVAKGFNLPYSAGVN